MTKINKRILIVGLCSGSLGGFIYAVITKTWDTPRFLFGILCACLFMAIQEYWDADTDK